MRAALAVAVLVAACRPLPPAPLVALHDDTAGAAVGTTTGMLVVGMAGDLGGGGWGTAFRVEQQVTTRTALGGELVIGRGDDGEGRDIDLIAVRGYGHGVLRDHRWVAVTYGVGAAWTSTGMLSVNGFGGGAVSYPNDYFSPYLQVGVAPVLVVRAGDAYGDHITSGGCLACEDRAPTDGWQRRPRSTIYLAVDAGLVGHLGDRGNRLAVDLGLGLGLGAEAGFLGLSIVDSQRFEQ